MQINLIICEQKVRFFCTANVFCNKKVTDLVSLFLSHPQAKATSRTTLATSAAKNVTLNLVNASFCQKRGHIQAAKVVVIDQGVGKLR